MSSCQQPKRYEGMLTDFALTSKEQDMLKTLRTLTKIENLKQFSSDDFRRIGLDRYIIDKQHGIGAFFAKLVKNKIVRQVGHKHSEIPSNHFHEIKIYEWEEKGEDNK